MLQVVNLPQTAGTASILKPEAIPQVWRPCTSDSPLPPPTINHGQCSIQAKAQPSRATFIQASMHSPGNAKASMGNRPYLTPSTTVQTSRQTEAFDAVLTDTHASLQAKASPQVQVCKQASTHEIAPCTTPLNRQVSVPGGTPFVPGNVQFEPPATLGAVSTTNNDRRCGALPLPQPVHNQSTFLPANIVNTYVCCKVRCLQKLASVCHSFFIFPSPF
jgi:hypothetical protein